ncbi:MAG: LysR family transcriptional regulator, partial [Lachnospiraceae bacterium]|nr:LysR family transcriptional regulator [Lachnospiraceae bacterium]
MLSEELHTFIVTCETGSFTKAADRLFLSPPAVMK